MAVNLACAGLAELAPAFPSNAVGNTCGRTEVSLIGRVNEDGRRIFFDLAACPFHHPDGFDITSIHNDVGRIGIELPFKQNRDFVRIDGNHLQKGLFGDRRLEMIPTAAIPDLIGIGPIGLEIVPVVPLGKFQEQSRRRPSGRYVRGAKPVGGKAPDVVRTFQNQYIASLSGRRDGGHDSAGRTTDDHEVVGGCGTEQDGGGRCRKYRQYLPDHCSESFFRFDEYPHKRRLKQVGVDKSHVGIVVLVEKVVWDIILAEGFGERHNLGFVHEDIS